MQAAGCDRILVIPLYPQYAAATTATVCDKVFDALRTMRWQPSVRIAPPWFDDRVYIDAVANSVQHELGGLSFVPEVLIASFHGMPEDYVRDGDPYLRQCTETVRLLRERLRRTDDNLLLTFQSRFGPREWLKPYTDETVRELAKKGVRSIAVVTPGFTADCLETLEEIAMENAAIFRKAGGRNFAFIPCLNDSDDGMGVIRRVAVRELSGWI
jgi:ferrochelatase